MSETSAAEVSGVDFMSPAEAVSPIREKADTEGYGRNLRDYANCGRDPDLWLYRERTTGLLKRYVRMSIEVGRLPSLLGRELFRSKVTAYRMTSFEDAVIFVHDVERVLDELDRFGKELVAVMIFEDYSQDEAAQLLRCGRRTVCRVLPEILDQITERFLEGGLLNRLVRVPVENSCQEGQEMEICASTCKQDE